MRVASDELRHQRIGIVIDREPEPQGARHLEGARPTTDHGGKARVRFEPDATPRGGAGGSFEAVQQLRGGDADARQVDRPTSSSASRAGGPHARGWRS